MNRSAKLLVSILNNTRDVTFADACKAAELIGFRRSGGKGSHTVYTRPDELVGLNFQNRNGKIAPYQARQLVKMIEKYRAHTA